mgnify:CR=1 FL=1
MRMTDHQSKEEYVAPTLEKRESLTEIAEGIVPVVS